MKVDTRTLRETPHDPSGFASLQGAIGVQLILEQPLAGDDVGVGRSRYKCPRSVVLERVVLLLHCGHPLWVAHGGAHRRWWGCRLGRRCQVRILGIGHPDPMLRTCDHVVSWRLSSGRW